MQLKIFFYSDVLIAGSASKSGASFILLQLCELSILKGCTCHQVIEECNRNIKNKLPEALSLFEKIIKSSLEIIDNPTSEKSSPYKNMAHPKDITILTAAIEARANYLITFNIKHFQPASDLNIIIITPSELLQQIRTLLNELIKN